jgi:Flp pilus assembly protein TadD
LPHHPAHSRAYKLLGSALFALGRPAAARDALRRALSLDPDYADAHCDLGCALCALGDATGAAAAFSAALRASGGVEDADDDDDESPKQNPGLHRESLFNLANLRRATGDFAAAVCGYDRVLALDPGHWRAHLGRAVALLGSRRDGDARGALRIALALSGVEPSALEGKLKLLREAAAAPNPERATLAAAMAAVADRAAAVVAESAASKE